MMAGFQAHYLLSVLMLSVMILVAKIGNRTFEQRTFIQDQITKMLDSVHSNYFTDVRREEGYQHRVTLFACSAVGGAPGGSVCAFLLVRAHHSPNHQRDFGWTMRMKLATKGSQDGLGSQTHMPAS